MRRSLWTTFVISLTLTSCYEPLGDSALVTNRAELKGVCQDASLVEVKVFKSGEVELNAIEGAPLQYEIAETLCDGVDNDCDGVVDEVPNAPLAMKQDGVCAGSRQRCDGNGGWLEPDYTQVEGYGEEQCDGLDNDCDGEVDEETEEPPLADFQEGICAESVKVCEGGSWVEPEYVGLTSLDYMDGDGLDNDCDGEIDELAPPPCFSSPNGCPELDFVTIEAGSFEMGSTSSSDEQPIHMVTVPSFELTRTEVTVGQYRTCVDADWCSVPGTGSGCNWAQNGREDHPINCVDWGQARTFAKWLGDDVDLPTEAQWEYGARGGESYTYSGSDDPNEVAWYTSNSGGSTKVVATKQANGFGLHDMSGNVWEWVLDQYHSSYSGAPNHASEVWGSLPECSQMCDIGSARRVYRGGSWSNIADDLRVANRSVNPPDYRGNGLGFRLRRTRSLGPIGPLAP